MAKVEVMMDRKSLVNRNRLDRKLVELSWALFLILVGGSWILENAALLDNSQKWGIIYAGTGAILLLLNVLRLAWKLDMSKFSIGLGVLGVLLGIGKYYAIGNISIWAVALLIIGIFMLFEVMRK